MKCEEKDTLEMRIKKIGEYAKLPEFKMVTGWILM